jgi:D-3-phosphoglycerate dehydrogenase
MCPSGGDARVVRRTEILPNEADRLLINTSRGPVVDEAALVAALENKKIAGAALTFTRMSPLSIRV